MSANPPEDPEEKKNLEPQINEKPNLKALDEENPRYLLLTDFVYKFAELEDLGRLKREVLISDFKDEEKGIIWDIINQYRKIHRANEGQEYNQVLDSIENFLRDYLESSRGEEAYTILNKFLEKYTNTNPDTLKIKEIPLNDPPSSLFPEKRYKLFEELAKLRQEGDIGKLTTEFLAIEKAAIDVYNKETERAIAARPEKKHDTMTGRATVLNIEVERLMNEAIKNGISFIQRTNDEPILPPREWTPEKREQNRKIVVAFIEKYNEKEGIGALPTAWKQKSFMPKEWPPKEKQIMEAILNKYNGKEEMTLEKLTEQIESFKGLQEPYVVLERYMTLFDAYKATEKEKQQVQALAHQQLKKEKPENIAQALDKPVAQKGPAQVPEKDNQAQEQAATPKKYTRNILVQELMKVAEKLRFYISGDLSNLRTGERIETLYNIMIALEPLSTKNTQKEFYGTIDEAIKELNKITTKTSTFIGDDAAKELLEILLTIQRSALGMLEAEKSAEKNILTDPKDILREDLMKYIQAFTTLTGVSNEEIEKINTELVSLNTQDSQFYKSIKTAIENLKGVVEKLKQDKNPSIMEYHADLLQRLSLIEGSARPIVAPSETPDVHFSEISTTLNQTSKQRFIIYIQAMIDALPKSSELENLVLALTEQMKRLQELDVNTPDFYKAIRREVKKFEALQEVGLYEKVLSELKDKLLAQGGELEEALKTSKKNAVKSRPRRVVQKAASVSNDPTVQAAEKTSALIVEPTPTPQDNIQAPNEPDEQKPALPSSSLTRSFPVAPTKEPWPSALQLSHSGAHLSPQSLEKPPPVIQPELGRGELSEHLKERAAFLEIINNLAMENQQYIDDNKGKLLRKKEWNFSPLADTYNKYNHAIERQKELANLIQAIGEPKLSIDVLKKGFKEKLKKYRDQEKEDRQWGGAIIEGRIGKMLSKAEMELEKKPGPQSSASSKRS